MTLLVDFCDYKAAKYAVEHWHYSRSLPTPPRVTVGVWEDCRYIGCVIFSRGASKNMLKPYGLQIDEGCELTRVALDKHREQVTKILRFAVGKLKETSPCLRLIVSYADPNNEHLGIIYQAGNWIYAGKTSDSFEAVDALGRVWHPRQVSRTGLKTQYGEIRQVPKIDDCTIVPLEGKHRYLYPLDRAMRRQKARLSQPYPKNAGG